MKRRNTVTYFFSLLITLSLTPQSKTFAQSSITGCQAELYQLSTTAETQTLTASDLIGSEVEQINIDSRLDNLPNNSPYKSSATKNIAQYWQMRVNNSDLSINAGDVKYRLIASNATNNPFKEGTVEIRALDSIEEIEECSDDTTVITGGISLVFTELENLIPGTFPGNINVCVPVNGNICQ
ncbi:MAG: hypothetical protein AAFS12_13775 [Cyanobacteria bacterium J06632_19]